MIEHLQNRFTIRAMLDMGADARKRRTSKTAEGEPFQLGSIRTVRHAHWLHLATVD
jgi:hypothetical protein